eukprot:SAG11_NODE_23986_length_380_cov_0.409253_1_plen_57_part_10
MILHCSTYSCTCRTVHVSRSADISGYLDYNLAMYLATTGHYLGIRYRYLVQLCDTEA